MKYSISDTIWDFLKRNKTSIVVYFILSLSIPLTNIALPHFYGKIISQLTKEKNIPSELKKQFFVIFVIWFVIQLLWSILNYIDSYFIPALQNHVRKYLIAKILDSYKQNYKEQEIGNLLSKIIQLPNVLKNLMNQTRNYILPMLIAVITSSAYYFYLHPKLGTAVTSSLIVFFVILKMMSSSCLQHSMSMNLEYSNLHENISNVFENLINVYVSAQSDKELEKIDQLQEKYSQLYRKTIQCSSNHKFFFNMSYLLVFAAANGTAFYLFAKKEINLDSVVSTLIVSLYMITEITHLTGEIDSMLYNISTIQQIQESIDRLESYNSNGDDKSLVGSTISFNNVKNFVINNLNLTILKNKKVALVGKIGSGKTTLVNILMRLTPFQGSVTIDGKDVRSFDVDHLRNSIIYVPQHPKLFNTTIYENVAYGNDATEEEVQDMLDDIGLPFENDFQVGKNGQNLSGGQRQIIYLLRCFFKKANIAILDEPTSSLDFDTKNIVIDLLEKLLKDKTTIMITHDQSLLRLCDRMIEIQNGSIVRDVRI